MNTALRTGYGMEMEGHIVDDSGRPVSLDNRGQPLIAWLQEKWARAYPQLASAVSAEQLAHMVEVKSDVVRKYRDGLRQVYAIREELNHLLREGGLSGEIRSGLRIIFVPVLSKKPDLIAASFDPLSRSHQLVKAWSATPAGRERLYDTSIASCQVNNSNLFEDLSDEEAWELAVALYNAYTPEKVTRLMNKFNNNLIRNHDGLTRKECLERLLPGVKGAQFERRGYMPRHVIYPPKLYSPGDLQHLYVAHSDVVSFAKASCKDAHAIGLKIKLRGEDDNKVPYMAETRWIDASEDFDSLCRAIDSTINFDRDVLIKVLRQRLDSGLRISA